MYDYRMGQGPHGGVANTLMGIDFFPSIFLKVLGILKGLFQKSLKRVQGRALPLSQ